jgi:hypothetical protein
MDVAGTGYLTESDRGWSCCDPIVCCFLSRVDALDLNGDRFCFHIREYCIKSELDERFIRA